MLVKVRENNRRLVSTFSMQNLCMQRILAKESGVNLLKTLGMFFYLSAKYLKLIKYLHKKND